MRQKTMRSLPGLAVLFLLPLSGCAQRGLVLDFNGRTIQVSRIENVSFPRGLEITHFDGRHMKVNGREAILVNGKELRVSGSTVYHGEAKHALEGRSKVIIAGDGTVRIVEQAETGESGGWLGFWR